jgi:hypothetical protein
MLLEPEMHQPPARLRTVLLNLLIQYGQIGLSIARLAQLLPNVERGRIGKTLENMRRSDLVHCVAQKAPLPGLWFSGPDIGDPTDPLLSALDFKRIERARTLDRLKPLRLCGSDLPGGRCPSVWTYANSFIERSHP